MVKFGWSELCFAQLPDASGFTAEEQRKAKVARGASPWPGPQVPAPNGPMAPKGGGREGKDMQKGTGSPAAC